MRKIDISAFAECDKLSAVHYSGTESQWNSIRIENGNDSLTRLTPHFEVAHTVSGINAALDGDSYSVTGQISALAQDTVLYCGVYSPEGRLVSVSSQAFQASSSQQEIGIRVEAGGSNGMLKLFVLGSGEWTPLEDSITVYL